MRTRRSGIMVRTVFLLVVVLTTLLVGIPELCEANIRITNNTANSENPSIKTDANGISYIVWQDNRDGNWEIYFSKIDKNGVKLILDTRLTNTPASSTDPDIAIDSSGNSYIVWEEQSNVHFCKLDQNGNKLINDIIVDTSSAVDYSPNPVISTQNDGTSHIAWEKRELTFFRIYYCRLDANGNKLTDNVLISNLDFTGSAIPKKPSVFDKYIVWWDIYNGNTDIYIGYDGYETVLPCFCTKIIDSSTARKPFISASSIAYQDKSGGKYEVFYYEAGTGRKFQVSEIAGISDNPVVVADSAHNSLIAWEDDRDGNKEIYLAKVIYEGSKDGNDVRITNDPNQSLNPDISVDGNDDWYLVWQDNRDGNWEIYFDKKGGINSPPSTPTNIAPGSNVCVPLTPTLESSPFSDPDGDTHLASQWQIRDENGDYSTPVYDSGTDVTNLIAIDVPIPLNTGSNYYWHVRHQDSRGSWSDYSIETYFKVTLLNGLDSDCDGITDSEDKCPLIYSENQSDSDGDALPDEWEERGYFYDGVNTVELDAFDGEGPAKVCQKDLFIWIDHMYQPGNQIGLWWNEEISCEPTKAVIDAVKNAFAARNIILHVNFGGHYHRVHSDNNLYTDDIAAGLGSYKDDSNFRPPSFRFTEARSHIYRYALFANRVIDKDGIVNGASTNPRQPEQGLAIAARSLISVGNAELSWARDDVKVRATLMHEFGHSLGLDHGGPIGGGLSEYQWELNHKPNYLSIMNYLYYHFGDGLTIVDANGKKYDGILDYSIFPFYDLNEEHLIEKDGVKLKGDVGFIYVLPYGAPQWSKETDYRIWFLRKSSLFDDINPWRCWDDKCLVADYVGQPVNWNLENGDNEVGVQADINMDAFYDLLRTSTDWDQLMYKGSGNCWRIGKEPSQVMCTNGTSALLVKKDLSTEKNFLSCSEPAPLRYYSDYRFILVPYKENSVRISIEAGKRVAFGVIIMNIGMEPDTYDIVASTEQGWTVTAESIISLDPGHRKVLQLVIQIPQTAVAGTEERVYLEIRSQGNNILSEGENFYIIIENGLPQDTDGDNLPDQDEVRLGLDPSNPDTDGDGIFDGVELVDLDSPEDTNNNGIIDAKDPFNITPMDTDGDGIGDTREVQLGFDPNNPDTDGDGLSDGIEVGTPRDDDPPIDFDGDGIPDALEPGSDANNPQPFSITSITQNWTGNNDITITWESTAVLSYDIYLKDTFTGSFTKVDTVVASGSSTSWTDDGTWQGGTHPTSVQQRYYKVSVNSTDSENTVGMYKITASQGMNLISLPLIPFSTALKDVIGPQVTGAGNEGAADRIWVWDGTNYQFAWLVEGTGTPFDGKWFTGNSETTITLKADQGAWLQIRPGHGNQTVYLLGEVSSTDREIPLSVGMNLVGTCYPVSVPLGDKLPIDSNLWESGATGAMNEGGADRVWSWTGSNYQFHWLVEGVGPTYDGLWYTGNDPSTLQLAPGKGYWVQIRPGHDGFTWVYPRPY